MVVLYVNCTKTIWYWMCVCHMIYNQSLLWFCIIFSDLTSGYLNTVHLNPSTSHSIWLFFMWDVPRCPSKSNQDILVFPRYSHNSHHIPARFRWYSHVFCEIVWTTRCPIFPVATPPPNSERCSNHRCQLGQFATPHKFGTLWQLHPGPVFSRLQEIHWPGMLEREFLCHMPWGLCSSLIHL